MARVKIGNVYPTDEYLLGRCAPTGYGLGVGSVLLSAKDNLDTIKANGWYYWNADNKPAGVPETASTGYLQAMRVWTTAGGTCIQELVDISGSTFQGCKMQRTMYGNNVFEWEWINPPVTAGYEYRTTERWNNRSVYTMLVDCGVTVAGTKQIDNPTGGTPIRYAATSGGAVSPYRPGGVESTVYLFEVSVDSQKIHLNVGTGEAGKNAYVQIWYVKN